MQIDFVLLLGAVGLLVQDHVEHGAATGRTPLVETT